MVVLLLCSDCKQTCTLLFLICLKNLLRWNFAKYSFRSLQQFFRRFRLHRLPSKYQIILSLIIQIAASWTLNFYICEWTYCGAHDVSFSAQFWCIKLIGVITLSLHYSILSLLIDLFYCVFNRYWSSQRAQRLSSREILNDNFGICSSLSVKFLTN